MRAGNKPTARNLPILAVLLLKVSKEKAVFKAKFAEQKMPPPIFAAFPVKVTPLRLKLLASRNTPPALPMCR